jgi:ankyrin repeat protein
VELAGVSTPGARRCDSTTTRSAAQNRRRWEFAALAGLILLVGAAVLGYLHYQRQQDLNFQLALALDDASQNGRALLLLRRGADLRAQGPLSHRNGLSVAATLLDERLLQRALAAGADPRAGGVMVGYPLDDAIEASWNKPAAATQIVRRLLKAGADPNATSFMQDPPLVSAARMGYADIVRALLEHGANPAARGRSGQTALEEARRQAASPRGGYTSGEDYPGLIRLLGGVPRVPQG